MNGLCYRYDPDTKEYNGPDQAQESPLEPGVWLWPANTTTIEPLPPLANNSIHFTGDGWAYQPIPLPIVPTLPPPTDPRSLMQCSRFQGKVSLLNAGLLTQVEAYFADAATPTLDKLAWQDTTTWYRLSPLVENMGTKFSLTPEQIDALFVYANGVQI